MASRALVPPMSPASRVPLVLTAGGGMAPDVDRSLAFFFTQCGDTEILQEFLNPGAAHPGPDTAFAKKFQEQQSLTE